MTTTDHGQPASPDQPGQTPADALADGSTPTAVPEPAEPLAGREEPPGGDREAARYRRRLRETETERDALRGTLTRLQTADVERLAGEHLAVPGDLFTFGTTLADVLGDDGAVDPGKVTAAAAGLLETRPGLAKPPPRQRVDTGGGRRGPVAPGASWSDVITGS